MIPHKWIEFICHVGRPRDQCSIADAGPVAGGKERKEGRQTIFFTPLDSLNSDVNEAELITDIKKPRKVHNQIHWRPEQDAVYWVHLRSAQDAGLEFWRTGSNDHHYVPVRAERMRRDRSSAKAENENYSPDNSLLEKEDQK